MSLNYIPVRPDLAIPSVKFFWRKMYITRMGVMEIRQPASIQTISSRAFTLTVPLLNRIRVREASRFLSWRAIVLLSVKNEVLT